MKRILFFCILCLTTLTVLGEENTQVFLFDSFDGGLNTKYSPNIVPKNQATVLQNFTTDEKQGIIGRKGYTFVSKLPVNSSVKILNTYVYNKDDGTSHFIVQAGSMIFSVANITDSWTTIKTGVSELYPYRWTTHYDKAWGCNGVGDTITYDGTTVTPYSFVPKGLYPLSANGRLWIACTVDEPSKVFYSDIDVEPTSNNSWSKEWYVNEGMGDGQVIKGLDNQKGIVWYYKDNSMYGIYDIDAVKLLSSNYGTLSQRSIADYANGKIFFDKKGLFYFAGGNVQYLSDKIDNEISKIGLINTSVRRITTTTEADFDKGTYTDCFSNFDEVVITTRTKTWTTLADFTTTYVASNHTMITNNVDGEVQISTATGGNTKIALTYIDPPYSYATYNYGNVGGLNIRHGEDNAKEENINMQLPLGMWNWTYATDNDDTTFTTAIFSQNGQFGRIRFDFPSATNIARVKMRYQFGVYNNGDWWLGSDHVSPVIFSKESFWIKENVGETFLECSKNTFENRERITTLDTTKSGIEIPRIIDNAVTTTSLPQSLFVGVQSAYLPPRNFVALKIYDISAFTESVATSYFSSGTYISPIYDTGLSSPSYQTLTPSPISYIGTSTGSIKYTAYSSDFSNMATPSTAVLDTIISGSTNTYCIIPTTIDNHRYFQWKAELYTSSTTGTPVISDMVLQYATTYFATYISQGFNVDSKITGWGSFVADTEGTISLYISSNTQTWTAITSGSDIGLPITSTMTYFKAELKSKDAKLKSVYMTYNTSSGDISGGGTQDTPATNIDDRWYMAYSTWASYNTDVLVFNKNKVFERWSDYPVSSFAKFNNIYYFASSTQPVINQMFSGTSDKEAIWKSCQTDLGNSDIDKKLRYALLTFEPKANSWCWLDYSVENSTITNKVYFDMSGNVRNKKVDFADLFGRNFYFTIWSTSTARPEIQSLGIYYDLYDIRGNQ